MILTPGTTYMQIKGFVYNRVVERVDILDYIAKFIQYPLIR